MSVSKVDISDTIYNMNDIQSLFSGMNETEFGNKIDSLLSSSNANEVNFAQNIKNMNIHAVFGQYDQNQNGVIDIDEDQLFASLDGDNTNVTNNDLVGLFKKLLNGITKDNFLSILSSSSGSLTPEEAFAKMDTNKDGILQENEINEGLTNENLKNFFNVSTADAAVADPAVEEAAPAANVDNAANANAPSSSHSGGASGGSSAPTKGDDIKALEDKRTQVKTQMDTDVAAQEAAMAQAIQNDTLMTQEQKQKYQTDISGVDAEIAQVESDLIAARTSLMETEVSITDTTAQLDWKGQLVSDCDSKISERESSISSLKGQRTDENASSIDSQISAIQSEIDSLKTKKKTAEDDKAALETKLGQLNTDKATFEAKVNTELPAKLTELQAKKDTLMTEMAKIVSPETKTKIDEIQKNISDIKKTAQDTITEIDNQIKALKVENNKDKLEVQKIQESNDVVIPDFISDGDAQKIMQLHPIMQKMMVEFFTKAHAEGLEFSLELGQVRTLDYQEDLRSRDSNRYGKPSPFGTSALHSAGLAVDITPINGTSYNELSEIGKSCGLRWAPEFRKDGGEPWHYDAGDIVKQIVAEQGEKAYYNLCPSVKENGSTYADTEFYTYEEIIAKGY